MNQCDDSLGVTVESPGFGGVGVRKHAHTPKSGSPPRRFLMNQGDSQGQFGLISYNISDS